jgi:NAD(P)-dependent dehydrogenase (short-subunit alcohol dehydrogenase family)
MKNEKVVIIGGSSGMGLASAKRLTTEGYTVVVSARSQERVAQGVAAYDQMPAEQKATMLRDAATRLPVQRVGQPDDIAEAVLFLVRERYITGAVLDVDGGARIG